MSDGAGEWEGIPAPRRPLPLLVLVLLGILAVVAVGAGIRLGGPAPTLTVESVEDETPDRPALPSPSPSSVASSPAPPADGWEKLPAAPVGIPGVHRGVWTGRELVVFGASETAAYSPESRQWRQLPPPPPPILEDTSVTWTGTEVVLWGGALTVDEPEGLGQEPRGGAALDPATGEWRLITEAPLSCPYPASAWTGAEIVYWGAQCHTEDGTSATVAAAYDPSTDRWRITQPATLEPAAVRMMWTGSEVVAWGDLDRYVQGAPSFAVAYDPNADAWRELPPPPLAVPSEAVGIWTGSTVVLWGSKGTGDRATSVQTGVLLDSGSDDWWPIGAAPAPEPRTASSDPPYGFAAVWTGDQMLIAGGYPTPVDLSYDPADNSFTDLPASGDARVQPVVAWTGEQLLVWGGYTTHGPDVDLVSWTPPGRGTHEPDTGGSP